ncbi:unannotated protein [freshwater metagenome]|uniref:Unannotated protein n=1 Tax=freshwater metagenome TaxID=449393 RepID=A0A6J7C1L2_9ZZZZ
MAFATQRRRIGRERAVVATIATQARQRDEDLAAVGDDARAPRAFEPAVAHRARQLQESVEVVTSGVEQRGGLVEIEGHTSGGARQRASNFTSVRC